MKINIDDIRDAPKTLSYTEDVDDLNRRLAEGVADFRVPGELAVTIAYYRAGLDLFFEGSVHADARGTCARCAEEYGFTVDAPFRFVLTPRAAGRADDEELGADDLALGFYEGHEVDLTPLVHEHAILSLPTVPLCRDDCRGLCPGCGANRNTSPCACATTAPPTRLAAALARARRAGA